MHLRHWLNRQGTLTFRSVEDNLSQSYQEMKMAKNAERGFFRGAMDALVEARARQANRYVENALRILDGETVRRGGQTAR